MSRCFIVLCFLLFSVSFLVGCSSGGGGSGSNGARFSLFTPRIDLTAEQGENSPKALITGSVSGVTENVYIFIELPASNIVWAESPVVNGTSGSIEIYGSAPRLLEVGTYEGVIQVSVCKDPSCSQHLAGSPTTVDVSYMVKPAWATLDNDNDGTLNGEDFFPDDPTEQFDFDRDGLGNNIDVDDDNDGVEDDLDEFPNNNLLIVAKSILTIQIPGDLSVTVDSPYTECTETCTIELPNKAHEEYGLNLTIHDGVNYVFGSWNFDQYCSDKDRTCHLQNLHFTPEVTIAISGKQKPNVTLTIPEIANGFILDAGAKIQCESNCEEQLYAEVGQEVKLVAVPHAGYRLSHWGGVCSGTEDCSFILSDGANVHVEAKFEVFNTGVEICSSESELPPADSGVDPLPGINSFIALCAGKVIAADETSNQIVVRDIFNGVTIHYYPLEAAARKIVLDRENLLLYVTHRSSTSFFSRVDLRSGAVTEIYRPTVEDRFMSAIELVVASDGDVLLSDWNGTQRYNSQTGLWIEQIDIAGESYLAGSMLGFVQETNTLVTTRQQYKWDRASVTLTQFARSITPHDGTNCFQAVVSADGKHGVQPCGDGNGDLYTVYDFDLSNDGIVAGEWDTGPYPEFAAFSPNSEYIALGNTDEAIVFGVDSFQSVAQFPFRSCRTRPENNFLDFSLDSQLIVGYACNTDSGGFMWHVFDSSGSP